MLTLYFTTSVLVWIGYMSLAALAVAAVWE
jgi:hypothetical protein